MKQNGFLLFLLAVCVGVSLAAGSLAIYTSAADVSAVYAGTHSFDLNAAVSVDVQPTVGPAAAASYPFEVSGSSLVGQPGAVDMTVFFGSTQALDEAPGLYAALVETSGGDRRLLKTVTSGDLLYEEACAFEAGDGVRTFEIELSYLPGAQSAGIACLAACQLFVTGAPHIES